jgi:DNA-binding transcriptional MerR regulator
MLYKPSEVSQFLDMPPSTLRRYARLFKKYLSPTGQQRRRKYTTQDIEIFEKIKTLSADGVPINDISGHLDNMPIDHQPVENTERGIMPANPEVMQSLESTDAKLDQILERLDRMENKSFWDRLRGK